MDDIEKQYGTSSIIQQVWCIVSQPSVNSNSSYNPETPNLGQNRWFLVPDDLEIWQMTLKNNIAPRLVYATSNFVHYFVAVGEFEFEL